LIIVLVSDRSSLRNCAENAKFLSPRLSFVTYGIQIFGPASAISKQFEARWFFDAGSAGAGENDMDGEAFKMQVHKMPFQRRNLSYWVGIQYGTNSRSRRQRRRRRLQQQLQEQERQGRHHRRIGTTKRNLTNGMTTQSSMQSDGTKPIDLLYEIWKHRVRHYNDAFLESPRRSTRNYSKRSPRVNDRMLMHVDPNPTTTIEATTPPTKDNNNNHVKSLTKTLSAIRVLERKWTAGKNDDKDEKAGDTASTDETEIIVSADGKGNTQSAPPMQDQTPNGAIPNRTSAESPVDLAILVSETDDSMQHANLRQHNNTTPISELDDMNDLLAWTKQGNADGHQNEFIDASADMRFHFLYYNDQRQLCFQTDATPDDYVGNRRCVFCYFDGGSNAGLLMHCVTCHGHYLSFKAARNEDGTVSQEYEENRG
jgi:hypothetical protein